MYPDGYRDGKNRGINFLVAGFGIPYRLLLCHTPDSYRDVLPVIR
jgi:hypothetical protein